MWARTLLQLRTVLWRRLPFSGAALKFAKPAILLAYDKAFDAAQAKLVAALREEGPLAVSKQYDKLQAKIVNAIQGIDLIPQHWRDKACDVVREEGDKFQLKLVTELQQNGEAGLNKLLDATQVAIKERIRAL